MKADLIKCPGCGALMDLSSFEIRPDQVICPRCKQRSIVPPRVDEMKEDKSSPAESDGDKKVPRHSKEIGEKQATAFHDAEKPSGGDSASDLGATKDEPEGEAPKQEDAGKFVRREQPVVHDPKEESDAQTAQSEPLRQTPELARARELREVLKTQVAPDAQEGSNEPKADAAIREAEARKDELASQLGKQERGGSRRDPNAAVQLAPYPQSGEQAAAGTMRQPSATDGQSADAAPAGAWQAAIDAVPKAQGSQATAATERLTGAAEQLAATTGQTEAVDATFKVQESQPSATAEHPAVTTEQPAAAVERPATAGPQVLSAGAPGAAADAHPAEATASWQELIKDGPRKINQEQRRYLDIDEGGNREPLAFAVLGLVLGPAIGFPPLGFALCFVSLRMTAEEQRKGFKNSRSSLARGLAIFGVVLNAIVLFGLIFAIGVFASSPTAYFD